MLSRSQILAAGIAVMVFIGIIVPGVTRYVLLGSVIVLFGLSLAWGGGHGILAGWLR